MLIPDESLDSAEGGGADRIAGDESGNHELDAEIYSLTADEPVQLQNPYFNVLCPECRAMISPRRAQAGSRLNCPECNSRFIVPQPSDDSRPQQGIRAEERGLPAGGPQRAESDSVDSGEGPSPGPRFPRREPRNPNAYAPPWTFFSGVFDFPLQGDAARCWTYIAIGCFLVESVALLAHMLSQLAGGGIGMLIFIGVGGLMLLDFFLGVWTFSYASTCMLAIVQETAGGADEVAGWPEGDWREWLWPLFHFGYLALVAAGLGYGASRLTAGYVQPGMTIGAVVMLVWPILLLSTLESGNPLSPLSLPILRSLIVQGWLWCIFYLLSVLLAAGWLAVGWVLFRVNPFLAVFVTAPLLSALLLIYARLLGRLGWRIGRDQ